eukprot:TRINITY_DN33082_c0_g1_i1.p1 TRINITY_DN33082_c0_g1~~TRINITY_DN33082_c0_g1_i1.p1  ORF type:complete len:634 (+),score=69.05 TRINITY_DN33082_c0_g1_i1:704-2605(+)
MPVPFVHGLTPSGGGVSVETTDAAEALLPQRRRELVVFSTGNHASYPAAVISIWRALLNEYDFVLEDHSFDIRYCEFAGSCASAPRFHWVGEHLRSTLVRTCGGHYLKGFDRVDSLAERFEAEFLFGGSGSLLARVDLLLCSHPPYSCRLFWPLVHRHQKPLIGFFGGTLEAHVPGEGMQRWLLDFRAMALHPLVQFTAISPFLAEKMRYQTRVDIPAVRGFGFHILERGVTYMPLRLTEVLVWKNSYECETNDRPFYALLESLSADFAAGYQPAGALPPLHFQQLRDLRDSGESSYAKLANFRALVMIPYEVLTMTFYEFYHLAMPLFIPHVNLGAFFGYRGPVTFPHCDMIAEEEEEQEADVLNGSRFFLVASDGRCMPVLDTTPRVVRWVGAPGVDLTASCEVDGRADRTIVAPAMWKAECAYTSETARLGGLGHARGCRLQQQIRRNESRIDEVNVYLRYHGGAKFSLTEHRLASLYAADGDVFLLGDGQSDTREERRYLSEDGSTDSREGKPGALVILSVDDVHQDEDLSVLAHSRLLGPSRQRPRAPYSPFDRDSVTSRMAWLESYSDWARFPHIQRFVSLTSLIRDLYGTNLQQVSANMRHETEGSLVDAAAFWRLALWKVLSGRI